MASSSKKKGIHFFTVIYQSTIRDKKLMIPRNFISLFGQQLLGCDAATLEVPTGDKWEVGLKMDRKGSFWFCNRRWEEFTEFYLSDHGRHYLLFEYKGHSDFSVFISAEIDYPTLSRAVEEDSLSVEILDDVDAAANKRDVAKGKAPMVDDGTQMKMQKRKLAELMFEGDVGKGKAPMVDDGTRMKMQRRKLAGNVMSKKAATMDDGSENQFGSGQSVFKIKIKQCYLNSKQNGRIPFRFTKEHSFLRDVEQVMLEVGDKVWPVRLSVENDNYVSFGANWITFAKENSLELGDVCLFKLVTTSPDVLMKATVIRGNVSKEAATVENRVGSGHTAFEIQIQPCHLNSRYHGRIPFSFTKEHSFMKDVKQLKLEVGDTVWPVTVTRSKDKYHLGGGWIRFAKDNSLNLGDVCVFKLITESPDVRMKVTVIRGVSEDVAAGYWEDV